MKQRFMVEMTDLFNGEINYAWVKREEIEGEGLTDLALVRRAKKVLGVGGWRTRTSKIGDDLRLDFVGGSRVAFISFQGEG